MARITIELPDNLHKELKQAAKSANRSMHGEILHRIGRTQPKQQPTWNDLKQGVAYAAF